jgi:uncharacterized protein involved in outer membrane biogenesis
MLRDSELTVPISLDVPGGGFNGKMVLFPEGEGINAKLTAKIDKFNYSTLATRIKPESDMSGLLYLDIDLDSQTKYLDKLLKNASGRLDFAVVPHEFESGIIDLWAVGLLHAVLPKLGNTEASVINCVLARFDMQDGVMEEDILILDTTILRASGDATVDFNSEQIELMLIPESKNPQMFRLEAPVEVVGSFSDVKFGLEGGIIGSVMRMAVTTVTTPFKRMFGREIPADGSDLCTDPMAREPRE